MATVIKPFREILHGMKRYNVGDDYPEDDKKRVEYLTERGYLQPSETQQTKQQKRNKKGDKNDSDG